MALHGEAEHCGDMQRNSDAESGNGIAKIRLEVPWICLAAPWNGLAWICNALAEQRYAKQRQRIEMRFLAIDRYRNDSTGKGKAEQRKETLSDETLWNGRALT